MTFLKLLKYIFKLKSAILLLNPDPTTKINANPCGIRIPEPIFTGSTLILYAVLFRKD
jgi:hypothetical protein